MDKRKRLQIELSRQERKQVEELLSGGVQPGRKLERGRGSEMQGAFMTHEQRVLDRETQPYQAARCVQRPRLGAEAGAQSAGAEGGVDGAGPGRQPVDGVSTGAIGVEGDDHAEAAEGGGVGYGVRTGVLRGAAGGEL